MFKKFSILLAFIINSLLLFSASPQLVWHQTYGDPTDSQQVFVSAIDNYDNMFLAGAVYFNNTGSLIINCYDGIGNLMWNRLYSNTPPNGTTDKAVALFPNNQAGVTVIASVNTDAVLTHIITYNGTGNIQSDYMVGDPAAGNRVCNESSSSITLLKDSLIWLSYAPNIIDEGFFSLAGSAI